MTLYTYEHYLRGYLDALQGNKVDHVTSGTWASAQMFAYILGYNDPSVGLRTKPQKPERVHEAVTNMLDGTVIAVRVLGEMTDTAADELRERLEKYVASLGSSQERASNALTITVPPGMTAAEASVLVAKATAEKLEKTLERCGL